MGLVITNDSPIISFLKSTTDPEIISKDALSMIALLNIMSSLFMKQFINKNTKWIHIDIAGQSYKTDDIIKYASPEASGVGVRLLFAYFE